MEVKNLSSPQTGNAVPNQFEIRHRGETWFQSYSTVIAKVDKTGRTWLDPQWDYSKTTMKYLGRFLGGYTAKEIRAEIKAGHYQIKNLNK